MARGRANVALILLTCALVVLVAGCRFDGLRSAPLPGTVGTGEDSFKVTVQLPDVGTLSPNAEVKVDDVTVGTVTRLEVVDWHAQATLSLDDKVRLPANAVARVGVNSLLGAGHVELSSPAGEPSHGELADGDRISLDRGSKYPSTEEVLASASMVLNGGGIENLSTITSELNAAFGEDGKALDRLLPRAASFIGTLNGQRKQIVSTLTRMDRVAKRFAGKDDTIRDALREFAPAIRTLSNNRPRIQKALNALSELDRVATPLVRSVRKDLVRTLQGLSPTLRALHRSRGALLPALKHTLAFPFNPETVANGVRGDYMNAFITLDLTESSLKHGLLGQPGLPATPGVPMKDSKPGDTLLPGDLFDWVQKSTENLLAPRKDER